MVWFNQWPAAVLVRMVQPARHSGMTATVAGPPPSAATLAFSVQRTIHHWPCNGSNTIDIILARAPLIHAGHGGVGRAWQGNSARR